MYYIDYNTLLSNSENCVRLKYFWNVYCVMTNHVGDQDTQATHKRITVAAYSLVNLTSDWLLLLDTIIFSKYFQCKRFSEFDSNMTGVMPNESHFLSEHHLKLDGRMRSDNNLGTRPCISQLRL